MARSRQSSSVSPSMSRIWPPTMPPAPAPAASSVDEAPQASAGSWWPCSAQVAEGEGQQGIAGEDGGGFVIGFVDGGAAAAEVVIVHGRQIVVDQRVAVDQLDRDGRRATVRSAAAPSIRGGLAQQEGPQALAALEAAVAHGGDQPRRGIARAGKGAGRRSRAVERGARYRRAVCRASSWQWRKSGRILAGLLRIPAGPFSGGDWHVQTACGHLPPASTIDARQFPADPVCCAPERLRRNAIESRSNNRWQFQSARPRR